MATGVVNTQGTRLWLKNPGPPAALVLFACPTGITGLGGARDNIPVECLGNTDDREMRPGLGSPGQVSVPFNLIPTNASHQDLYDLKASMAVLDWVIGLSDGTAPPTIDTDSDVEIPTGAGAGSYAQFQGYIADVNIDIATNSIVQGTLTIQRSGGVTWTWPA